MPKNVNVYHHTFKFIRSSGNFIKFSGKFIKRYGKFIKRNGDFIKQSGAFIKRYGIFLGLLSLEACTGTASEPRIVRHHPAPMQNAAKNDAPSTAATVSVSPEHTDAINKKSADKIMPPPAMTAEPPVVTGGQKALSANDKTMPIKTIGVNGINLKDSIGIALARHPDIGRANAVVAQGKAQIAIERAAWYPTLQYSVNPGYNRYYSGSNRNNDDNGNVRGTVGASQLLYDFGRTSSRIAAAKATNEKQMHQLSSTMEDVAQNMANIFIELSAAQDLIAAATHENNLLRDTRDKIAQRVKAGLSDASDLNQAEVGMQRAKSDLLQATTRFDVAAGKFAQITGFRPTRVATLAETTRFMDSMSNGKGDVDHTPAVLAAEAEVRASQQRVRTAKADRFPSISLGVSQSGATGQRNATNDSTFVGLQLSGQISTGKREKYQIEAAEAELRAARQARDNEQLVSRTTQGSAETEERGAAARMDNAKQMMDLSLSSRDLYWQQYTLNKRPLTDVINAERDTFMAESDHITAISDRLYAKIKAYYAVGQLVSRLRERV